MPGEIDSFISALPEKARSKDLTGIESTYCLETAEGEAWTVRVSGGEVTVHQGIDAQATCKISASEDTLLRLLRGELGAASAYLSGKLKLRGDLSAAMQLQTLLG